MTEEGERRLPAEGTEAQRLHPLTVLLELVRILGRVAWALILIVVVGYLGGRRTDAAPALFLLAGSGVLVALVRYLSLRYWIEEGRLVIRSGVVSQQLRTIPLDKIQNVELRQSAIHQLAGVVDLRIETAAGPGAEAHLAVLSREAAERLKSRLLAGRDGAGDAKAEAAPQVVWQAGTRQLLLLGATSNRAGAILGAVAGLLLFIGRELPRYLETIQRGLSGVAGTVSPLAAAGASLAALLLLGWLLAIGLTVVGYHGFRLTREPDGRLRRSYGLVSRFETVVAPARIQLLRIESSWLRRRLGFWEVKAHTAGSPLEGQGASSSLLCPLLDGGDLAAFCQRLLPRLDLRGIEWRPVSRAAIRRGFIRYGAAGVALCALAAAAVGRWAWTGVPIVLAASWLLARHRYRVLAYTRHGGHLLVRTGLLRRRLTVIPEGKVQWLGMTESPPQRRFGIATLVVATASGAGRIPDMSEGEAAALQAALTAAASAVGAWLPDAV